MPSDDLVELTDLDVIARYSLAVRRGTASRDELVEVLRADLAWLESEAGATATTATDATPTAAPRRAPAASRTPAKRAPAARQAPAAKRVATAKQAASKPAAAKRAGGASAGTRRRSS